MTTTKAYDILRKNFIIANYNSLGAVDNNDGSSYYISESNFFVYGGGGGLLSRGWRKPNKACLRTGPDVALSRCSRLYARSSPFAPPSCCASSRRFPPLSTGLKNDFEGHDNWWVGNVIAFPSGPLLHNGYGGKVGDPGKGYLDGHEDGFVGNTAIVGYEGSYAKPICPGSPGTTVMNSSRVFSPKGQLTTDCGASFDVGAQYAAYTATMADDFIGYARAAIWT